MTSRDPLESLTASELGIASRKLGADVVHVCSTEGHELRWDALPIVAWLLARRTDSKVELARFQGMTPGELGEHLDAGADHDEHQGDGVLEAAAANPTERQG